jgi:calcium/calmodulin-dependent protein kinase I
MGCGGSKEKKEGAPQAADKKKKADEPAAPVEKKPEPAPAAVAEPAKPAEPKKAEEPVIDSEFIITDPIDSVYEMGEEIGKGGFSVVYRATKKGNGEEFAIKVIQKKMVEGDDIKLLKREIQIMKKLDHPNILKLFAVYEDESQFYLVMELVRGKELFDKIVEKGMYSEKDAANIIRQVVSAVEYLHANGIAHRDLKPENLLSSGEGDMELIKIADFGFSKSFDGEDEKLMTSCGSPGYVAPEILTAESYDKSVDMWSVGVIIYILLSGYPPFYADSAPALFKKIMDVKYDFDDMVWDDISDDAKDLIQHLLVKQSAKRFSAREVLEHSWLQGGATDKPIIKPMDKADLKEKGY